MTPPWRKKKKSRCALRGVPGSYVSEWRGCRERAFSSSLGGGCAPGGWAVVFPIAAVLGCLLGGTLSSRGGLQDQLWWLCELLCGLWLVWFLPLERWLIQPRSQKLTEILGGLVSLGFVLTHPLIPSLSLSQEGLLRHRVHTIRQNFLVYALFQDF